MRKIFRKAVCALSLLVAMGCILPYGGCRETEENELKVYMPDGAPALALAGMMAADTEDDGVSYYVGKLMRTLSLDKSCRFSEMVKVERRGLIAKIYPPDCGMIFKLRSRFGVFLKRIFFAHSTRL